MSGYYSFLEIQYKLGNITAERLKTAVVKSYITADEYKQITGTDYTA